MRPLGCSLASALATLILAASASAAAPTITNTQISTPTTTSVTLQAEIDPQGKATEYHFEYGPADCASNPCTPIPVPDAKLPAKASGSGDLKAGSALVTNLVMKAGTFTVGQVIENPNFPADTKIISRTPTELTLSNSATATTPGAPLSAAGPQLVSQLLSGLTPATTYHFRAVAASKVTVGGGTTEGPDRLFATYAQPQIFEPCPNDLFRLDNPAAARIEHSSANLPDCRAYEMATPVDKDGADVTGTVPYSRAAADGGAITFLSSSGLPGGRGSQELPVYLGSREAGEWSTEGLLPPGNTGQRALVLGWTPDFEEVFARAIQVGDPFTTAFLMTPHGAAPQKIVDYTPNLDPKLAGASEDAAEVLFESKQALPGVAGAQQDKSNLYLWQRASKEITLAGVLNDQQAPPKGAFAGSYDWVRGTNPATLAEGGAAADYYTSEQHSIATDGTAVYFTAAGSGDLYLRRNPAASQSALDPDGSCTEPAKACTIQVNASQKTNGIIPSGKDPAGPQPAAFMGASADGSVAFFTSSEKLTDDANTGPEQEPAAIERADVNGDPQSIEPDFIPAHALGIAVDDTYIYWADPFRGTIGRATLEGDEMEPDFIVPGPVEFQREVKPGVFESVTVPSAPRYVAVDSGHVYWTNTGMVGEHQNPLVGMGTIGRAGLNGDPDTVEPAFIRGASNPQGIAVAAGTIYWANSLEGLCFDGTCLEGMNSIAKAGLDGDAVDQEFLEVGFSNSTLPVGLAADDAHLYFTVNRERGNGRDLNRIDFDGSNRVTVLLHENDVTAGKAAGIAVGPDHVYWAMADQHKIGRANLDLTEASVEDEFTIPDGAPIGIARGEDRLLWSVNGESAPNAGRDLYRYDHRTAELSDISIDSGAPAGTEVRGVLGVSEDGDSVFYAANGVPDDLAGSPNANGEVASPGNCGADVSAISGACNVYLSRGDLTTFIARLDISDGALGGETDAANWIPTAETIFTNTNFTKSSRITPDGRTLLFRSHAKLTAYDNQGVAELYRYRVGAPGVSCVSCKPTGAPPGGPPSLGSVFPSVIVPTNPSPTLAHNLSADGNRVFFETTDALVGSDINGQTSCPLTGSSSQTFPACLDVYEWEAQGTGSCDADHALPNGGCYYLISTGKGTEPALIADASGDGSDVYFYTRSQLVGSDEDQLLDVYDARVDGGLDAQNEPTSPPPCVGEGCKHAPTPAPSVESPPRFAGPENPKAKRPRCKKPKKLVKGRCVAKRHKGKKHHQARR